MEARRATHDPLRQRKTLTLPPKTGEADSNLVASQLVGGFKPASKVRSSPRKSATTRDWTSNTIVARSATR